MQFRDPTGAKRLSSRSEHCGRDGWDINLLLHDPAVGRCSIESNPGERFLYTMPHKSPLNSLRRIIRTQQWKYTVTSNSCCHKKTNYYEHVSLFLFLLLLLSHLTLLPSQLPLFINGISWGQRQIYLLEVSDWLTDWLIDWLRLRWLIAWVQYFSFRRGHV